METREQVIPGRKVPQDLRYASRLVEKLINYSMLDGKKSIARKIVYRALELAEERTGEPALDLFYKAVDNCSPKLETRSRRVGGAAYQVPFEVPPERQRTLALRWIVRAARARGERLMAERLAAEIVAAVNNEGKAYEKKLEAHRMAEANRPFAHYRW
ncbi:MAG: 30S ribosomal protein S7 [Thermoplasmata archaeon]|nr:30S ribosomal protein S7 [Thermoplasmata archaeon]NIY02625.1 30S ribosomal protein S7 [Thermoplasmata archaeon]